MLIKRHSASRKHSFQTNCWRTAIVQAVLQLLQEHSLFFWVRSGNFISPWSICSKSIKPRSHFCREILIGKSLCCHFLCIIWWCIKNAHQIHIFFPWPESFSECKNLTLVVFTAGKKKSPWSWNYVVKFCKLFKQDGYSGWSQKSFSEFIFF